MKKIIWDIEKNNKLKSLRGISFEEVCFLLQNNNIIDIIKNPNEEKYENQNLFVLNINDYIYYVPFRENEIEIFLITIVPSRKLTKKYLGKKI